MTVTLIRRDDGTSLTFDASPEQAHTPAVDVSTHPIAEGAEVADHAERKARRIRIEGIVTATPFVADGESPPDSPMQAAVEWLDGAAGRPLTLETSEGGTFEPVLLTRYPYTVDVVQNRVFDIELRQVRIAESRTIEIPPRKRPTRSPTNDEGRQMSRLRQSVATFETQEARISPEEKVNRLLFGSDEPDDPGFSDDPNDQRGLEAQ